MRVRPVGWSSDLHDPAQVSRRGAAVSRDAELLVQRQAVRWRELRIRVADDATFGPIISFGARRHHSGYPSPISQPICRR